MEQPSSHGTTARTGRLVLGLTVLALVASGCAIVRVSVSSTGAEGNKASSRVLGVSDDGRYSLYLSDADNLVPGDTNNAADVFRHDTQTGRTVRVSVGPNGAQAPRGAFDGAMSADGRSVAFLSGDLLDPTATGTSAAYVRDLGASTTTWVSQPPAEGLPDGSIGNVKISANGRYVSFLWRNPTTTAGFTAALYRRDRVAGTTTKRFSETFYIEGMVASSDGFHYVLQPACIRGSCFPVPQLIDTDGSGNRWPGLPWQACTFTRVQALSADGRFQVVHSAGGRPLPCLTAGMYLVDRQVASGTPLPGLSDANVKGINRAGTAVLYIQNGDLYLRDLVRNVDTRVGISFSGAEPNADIVDAILSDDGHHAALTTDASNLVDQDGNGVRDVFVRPALP